MEITELSMENIDCTQKIGGNLYYAPAPLKALDFSGGSNILPPPYRLLRAIRKISPNHRPDIEYRAALANIANRHGIDVNKVSIGKNVYSLLDVILKAVKARGATVLMPCETVYKDICRMNGCDVLSYVLRERKNFKFDSDDFIEGISGRTDTVVISNPNNVTGRTATRTDIKNILDFCLAKGIYVIVDETYMDFVPDGISSVDLISDYYNLIVIRSVSEYYNLSGIDAAYVVSSDEIMDNIREMQLPWQVDLYGAALCENAYKWDRFDLKTKKWIFEEKRKFVQKLKSLNNVKVIHSDCHFILLKLEDISATTVYNRLLKSNIIIRDASSFTGLDGSYIRVAVRDEKSNDLFIESLLKCLI